MYHLKHNTYRNNIYKLTGGSILTKQIHYLLISAAYNFVTSHSLVLLGTSLSVYALLNVS